MLYLHFGLENFTSLIFRLKFLRSRKRAFWTPFLSAEFFDWRIQSKSFTRAFLTHGIARPTTKHTPTRAHTHTRYHTAVSYNSAEAGLAIAAVASRRK